MWFKRKKDKEIDCSEFIDSMGAVKNVEQIENEEFTIKFEIEQEMLFNNSHLYSYCENCSENTYYLINSSDIEGNRLLSCKRCQFECSDVWCEKCGMGGDFVQNLGDRPDTWTCPECNTVYNLNEEFYENKVKMYPETMLTKDIKKKLK